MTPRQWLANAQVLDKLAEEIAEGTDYSSIAGALRAIAETLRSGADLLGRRDEASVLIH